MKVMDNNIFSDHPVLGLIISACSIAMAEISKGVVEIPLIIMQTFQLISYSIAIIVGVVTISGWYKKNTNNKNKQP